MNFADLRGDNTAMAVFPAVAGFGWIVFDGPLSPYRWGVSRAAHGAKTADEKNERCLRRVEKLLKEYRPDALVLEAFEGSGAKRSARIRALSRAIISLTVVERVTVRIISREDIASCFLSLKAHTREVTAIRTAEYLKEIQSRLPNKRKLWESENANAALMNAAALLIVHYANPMEPL